PIKRAVFGWGIRGAQAPGNLSDQYPSKRFPSGCHASRRDNVSAVAVSSCRRDNEFVPAHPVPPSFLANISNPLADWKTLSTRTSCSVADLDSSCCPAG